MPDTLTIYLLACLAACELMLQGWERDFWSDQLDEFTEKVMG